MKKLLCVVFFNHYYKFYDSANEELELLTSMYDRMKKLYSELMEYFCLDSNKIPAEEYFGDLNVFIKNFEVCVRDDTNKLKCVTP